MALLPVAVISESSVCGSYIGPIVPFKLLELALVIVRIGFYLHETRCPFVGLVRSNCNCRSAGLIAPH